MTPSLQVYVWKAGNADRRGGVFVGGQQAGHDPPSPLRMPISARDARQRSGWASICRNGRRALTSENAEDCSCVKEWHIPE